MRKYVVLRYCAVTLLAPRARSRSGSRPAASGWLLVWSPHAGWWPSWRWRLGLEHTAGRVKPIHPIPINSVLWAPCSGLFRGAKAKGARTQEVRTLFPLLSFPSICSRQLDSIKSLQKVRSPIRLPRQFVVRWMLALKPDLLSGRPPFSNAPG